MKEITSGQLFKKLRLKAGLSQEQVGRIVGLDDNNSRKVISKLEAAEKPESFRYADKFLVFGFWCIINNVTVPEFEELKGRGAEFGRESERKFLAANGLT